jgi:hypothetical protein
MCLGVIKMKKNNNAPVGKKHHEKSRRKFIKAAGKLLVWVPPALVVLSQNPDAFAAQSWNPGKGNRDHPGDGNGGPGTVPPR